MTEKRSPRIKICGLKDVPTLEAMDGLPIHEIGFVFAKSKRQVSPDTAASLIETASRLKGSGGERPRTAGVFVNPTLEELRQVIGVAPLDIVQLHGGETPQFCRAVKEALGVQVWKAISMKQAGESEEQPMTAAARIEPYRDAIDAVLIDSAGGGTGHTFDWEAIKQYSDAARTFGLALYVAGGLHADNVQQLLSEYSPDGVDVSSGVETDGQKDIGKIRLFVRKVMEAC